MEQYQHFKNRIAKAKKVPIEAILLAFGHAAKDSRKNGLYLWYHSPFSTTDKTPSFVVNTDDNTFKDFSQSDKGGDALDLLQRLNNCTLASALHFLESGNFNATGQRKLTVVQDAEYTIKKVQPLQNAALTTYLQSRCISVEIAKKYVEEIYYYLNGKHYFALCMKNRSNGYEVRNKYYKGCLSKKDITILSSGKDSVSIFEGFTDFLSVLTYKGIEQLKTDVIILHSVETVKAAKETLETYQKAYTFLDNDIAGYTATTNIAQIVPTKRMNYIYANYKDFNDFLTSNKQKLQTIEG